MYSPPEQEKKGRDGMKSINDVNSVVDICSTEM